MNNTLRFISVIYMMLLSVGLFAHVEIIPGLLNIVKRDAWISVLLVFIILPLWLYIFNKIISIIKKRSIITVLHDQNKKFIYYLLLLPLAIYMILNAIVTSKDIILWSQLSYMQGFDNITLALVLLIVCLICSESGFISIGILSSILCPLVILLGFFISFANIQKKNYDLLFPAFSDGYLPAIQGLLFTSLPILELFVLLFLTPSLKKVINKKQLSMLGLFIIFLMLGPTIGAIVEFGPQQASIYRYPAYEQWRLITVGKYFSHADFFAIFQWLSGGVIRISLFILIASLIFSKAKQNKRVIRFIYLILLAFCIYPVNQNQFYYYLYEYIRPITFFFLVTHITFLMIYLWINQRKILGDDSTS
ncbi:GerAB/ArcD/ProY family transporter [Ornithinibacillus xuwenensis]|uniref:GerAB/ArcD/ProY family transporter n=1 Tax=Ornithinibacillus xuwenensis TaxID=3144668 RepID=A0ABU9XHR5_9BACI